MTTSEQEISRAAASTPNGNMLEPTIEDTPVAVEIIRGTRRTTEPVAAENED